MKNATISIKTLGLIAVALAGIGFGAYEALAHQSQSTTAAPCQANCTTPTPTPTPTPNHPETLNLTSADFPSNRTATATFLYRSNGNQSTNAYIGSWYVHGANSTWSGSAGVTLPYTFNSYYQMNMTIAGYFTKGDVYSFEITTNFGNYEFLGIPSR